VSGFGNPQPYALQVFNSLSEIAALGASAQATARANLGLGTAGAPQFDYLGLGGARTLGRLQIVSGTTIADGIYFGSDTQLYRAGAGILALGASQVLDLTGSNGAIRLNGSDALICVSGVNRLVLGASNVRGGAGSPEGVVTAPVGSLYLRSDGAAATTLYVKESGAGNTGWVAK